MNLNELNEAIRSMVEETECRWRRAFETQLEQDWNAASATEAELDRLREERK